MPETVLVPSTHELALPCWAEEMKTKYESRETSQFLLYGNVYDVVPYRQEFVWLRDFLIRALSGGKDLVFSYNLSEGIRFASDPMKDEFKRFMEVLTSLGNLPPGIPSPALIGERPDLVKDPNVALPLIEKIIELRNRVFIILDHIDKVCPPHDIATMSMDDRRNLATLQRWSIHPKLLNRDNVVILIARNLADVHSELKNNPLLDMVEISFPDATERQEYIERMAQAEGTPLSSEFGVRSSELQPASPPTPAEPPAESAPAESQPAESQPAESQPAESQPAEKAVEKPTPNSELRTPNTEVVTPKQFAYHTAGLTRLGIQSFFRQAKQGGSPITLQMIRQRKDEMFKEEYGGLVEVIEPSFGLEAVGGLEEVKQELRMVVQLLREGNRYESPMGVGLIGPPGTGKTFLARAVAKEANMPFLRLGDIRDKFVGESEKNADRVLTLLRSLAPVVVFVDEIDQAFGSRGERGDSGVSQRIWAKFAEVQGDSSYRGQLLWMWATNRPDIMDEATKRPGRLGDLKIPFFFAAQDPEAVIRRSAARNHIQMEIPDLSPVIEKLKGYSAAEVEAMTLQSRWFARRAGRSTVTPDDLIAAADDYIPSRNDKIIEYMEILAILEASSMRLLPPAYRETYQRETIVERAHELRMELTARGLL